VLREYLGHRWGKLLILVGAVVPACGQSGATFCRIDGADYVDGTLNPGDPCLSCQTALGVDAWTRDPSCSGADAGTDGGPDGGLPDGGFCTIESNAYLEGTLNPVNACQICKAEVNPNGWSDALLGTSCDGGYCSDGRCLYGCFILGSGRVSAGFDQNQPNRCCNPTTSSRAWLPIFSAGASNPIASSPTAGNIFISLQASGQVDVEVVGYTEPQPTWNVFHGTSPGTFGNGVTTVIQSSLTSVFNGMSNDLDGDGIADLVIYGASQGVNPTMVALLGQANGGFSSVTEYPMQIFPQPGGVLVPLSKLGLPDVIVGGANLGVFFNLGGGVLAPEHLVAGQQGSGETMKAGDFNGDGNVDVATESAIYFGDGQGNFPMIGPGLGRLLAAGDFNRDGIMDLVVAEPAASSVLVFLGNVGGTFPSSIRTAINAGSPFLATVADFNGDGLPDLLVVSTSDNELLLGRGDGTFLQAATVLGPSPVAQLQSGDLNSDNHADIAAFDTRDGGSWTPWFNSCP
jgi:hypothetical protein